MDPLLILMEVLIQFQNSVSQFHNPISHFLNDPSRIEITRMYIFLEYVIER